MGDMLTKAVGIVCAFAAIPSARIPQDRPPTACFIRCQQMKERASQERRHQNAGASGFDCLGESESILNKNQRFKDG